MSQILFPPAIPCMQVAGRVFTDLANLKILYSSAAGATNGYSTPRLPDASDGYQVPVGKTFRVLAMIVEVTNAVANSNFTLGYQDTDTGICTNTGPTNGVKIGGTDYTAYFSQASVGKVEYAIDFVIPAQKYLNTYNGGTAANLTMKILGYEV